MSADNIHEEVHEEVKAYYRKAAQTGRGGDCCARPDDERWGISRYDADTLRNGSDNAAKISMGCGNPFAMADLRAGEDVLDLGSGGGLDVILSAKRVGPNGKAYGVDFLPEMIELARSNAADAGVINVEFRQGMIEDLPLADDSVDVVISNCVINLAPDKGPVFRELARVLRPGGRVAISDVVADDHFSVDDVELSDGGATWADCGAGALHHDRYLALLAEAGLEQASIEYTHETSPGLHGAIVRAVSPARELDALVPPGG